MLSHLKDTVITIPEDDFSSHYCVYDKEHQDFLDCFSADSEESLNWVKILKSRSVVNLNENFSFEEGSQFGGSNTSAEEKESFSEEVVCCDRYYGNEELCENTRNDLVVGTSTEQNESELQVVGNEDHEDGFFSKEDDPSSELCIDPDAERYYNSSNCDINNNVYFDENYNIVSHVVDNVISDAPEPIKNFSEEMQISHQSNCIGSNPSCEEKDEIASTANIQELLEFDNKILSESQEEENFEYLQIEELAESIRDPITLPTNMHVAGVGEGLSVMLFDVTNPCDFHLMVIKKENCNAILSISEELNHFYSVNECEVPELCDLRLHSHWVALNEDNHFVRVKVMGSLLRDKKCPNRTLVPVKFVDIGYTARVAVSDLRVMDRQFAVEPPFAINVALAKVHPLNSWTGEWPKDTITAFIELCEPIEDLTAYFITSSHDGRFDIVLENSDGVVVNEELVQRGLAKSSLLETIPHDTTHLMAVVAEKEQTVAETEEMVFESEARGADVTKVCPNYFAVEFVANCEEVWQPMHEDYNKATNNLVYDTECLEALTQGGVVNTDDERLCRFYSKGRRCPRGESCMWVHQRRRKDGLPRHSVLTYWNLSSPTPLPSLHDSLLCMVTAASAPNSFYIHLPFGIEPVYQDESDSLPMVVNSLQHLCTDLSQEYDNTLSLVGAELPSTGQLMVAQAALDGPQNAVSGKRTLKWYRVRILEVVDKHLSQMEEGAQVKVFFVDVGCTRWLHERCLRNIQPAFIHKPPPLAVECYLSGITPIDPTKGWGEGATRTLQEFAASNLLIATVTDVDTVTSKVGLELANFMEGETELINERLVTRGLALFE